ncbi:MAG: ACT domain-containing protein [bacterium]|nr:ACT domain-containing protein [bacterium]
MKSEARFVVNVVARDRVGIIADVTEALYQLGANLEALSQTVVWDWFTMILCGAFPEDMTAERIKESLETSGEFLATVLPYGEAPPPKQTDGEPFVVTAAGEDKAGIVRRLTRCFAEKGINVEDVWNEVRNEKFIVIFHVTLSPHVDPKDARYDLEKAAEDVGVTITLQHQDIFTATNSLEVHTKR